VGAVGLFRDDAVANLRRGSQVNARSFESAFIFYNTWTATAGSAYGASAPLSPAQNVSPPSSGGGRAAGVGAVKAVSPTSRALSPPNAQGDGDAEGLLEGAGGQGGEGRPGAASLAQSGYAGEDGQDRAAAARGAPSAGPAPRPYEPEPTITQGSAANKQQQQLGMAQAPLSPSAQPADLGKDRTRDADGVPGGAKVTPMEAYRAKLRLLSLDVQIVSSAGHLTVFEKDAEGGAAHWRNVEQGAGGRSREDEAGKGKGKGVLLNVPLPEFDVVGNTTLVLALGGLGRHSVEWASPGQVLIDKVAVHLPDSIILCVFRMPRDDMSHTQSLWLSPPIIDLAREIKGLHRKHRKPHHAAPNPARPGAAQGMGPKSLSSQAAHTTPERQTSPEASIESQGPSPAAASAAGRLQHAGGGEEGAASDGRAATQQRPPAGGAAVRPVARAVSGLDSTTVLMSDAIYSMRFADLELKLSAGERARDSYDGGQAAADGHDDVLALLSAQVLDVTAIVSRKQHLLRAAASPTLAADKAAWFSSIAVRLERLTLHLAQQPLSRRTDSSSGGGSAGPAPDGWQAEGVSG
jgi:hypothetical protein